MRRKKKQQPQKAEPLSLKILTRLAAIQTEIEKTEREALKNDA